MDSSFSDVRRRAAHEGADANAEAEDPSAAMFEIVLEAVKVALAESEGHTLPLARRMVGGSVVFRDNEGRVVKETDTESFFKKVTSIREKLRVLEQKINNNDALDATDKADFQVYLTRCYGTLTTFNFLFRDDADRFRGSGG
jgi:hypothetical protein